jgi:hypothetical protein
VHSLRRYSVLPAVYLLGLIPTYSLIAVFEGGVRGLWPLSTHDWVYQGSAFLVQASGLLIPAGVVAIPAGGWATRRFVTGQGATAGLFASVIAALSVFLGTCLFDPWILLSFPIAFLVSTGAYGLVVLRTVRRSQIVSPAT